MIGSLRTAPSDLSFEGTAADGALGEDFQLSLYLLYELHYRGFSGVDEGWEWEPTLLALRAGLEADFEACLLELVAGSEAQIEAGMVGQEIVRLVEEDDGPQLSST